MIEKMKTRRLSLRCGIILAATASVATATTVLVPKIQEARERARNTPHVSVFGQGSGQHFRLWITASGKPNYKVETQVNDVLTRLVPDLVKDEEKKQGSAHFTTLVISASALSHEGLAPLADCTQGLAALVLEDVQLSARSVKYISGVKSLIHLNLCNTGIPDSSLKDLRGLTALESLDLRDNNLSAVAIQKLQQALPDCQILS